MATVLGQKKGKKIDVSTNGERLVYSASREYIVYDETGVAGEGDVLSTSGLPLVNVLFQFDGVPVLLLCKSKSAQQFENNNKYWTVSAEFDNEPVQNNEQGSGQGENDSADPTTWFAIAKLDFENREWAAHWYKNFAKRPYANTVMVTCQKGVIKWTQYMPSSLSLRDLELDYTDVVNENRFFNYPSRVLKLNIASAEFGQTNGFECWKVNFELRHASIQFLDDTKVFDEFGNEIADRSYSGWDLLIPQMDTIDINKRPFTDLFENSGDTGKLDVNGQFLADQSLPFIMQRHQPLAAVDFSWIRIRQAQ